MNRLPIILCLAVLMGLIACKGELEFPDAGEPVFTVQAELDGGLLDLKAGLEGYYLNADHRLDDQMVREFMGTFQPDYCMDCPGQLRFVFRDVVQGENEPLNLDSIFHVGMHVYRGDLPEHDGLSFRFRPFTSGTAPFNYNWDFGDGTTSNDAFPKHMYDEPGNFEVSLFTQDANGCGNESRQWISAGIDNERCGLEFCYIPKGNSTVEFHINHPNPSASFSFLMWTMGDGKVILNDPSPVYTYSLPGIYEASLMAVSDEGTTCADIKNLYSETSASCSSFINYRASSDLPDLGKLYIEWTDLDGNLYTTDRFDGQPNESFFEIVAWEPFDPDIDGQPTLKLSVRFQCVLYNSENEKDFLLMNNGIATLAIAYPN